MNSKQRKQRKKSAARFMSDKLIPLFREMADEMESGKEDPVEIAKTIRALIADFELGVKGGA